MNKSLNQLYKESGTTLKYIDWRKREDEKMLSFNGDYESTKEEMKKKGGYKDDISNKTIFGINQNVLIIGTFVIATAIIFKIIKNRK